MKRETELSTGAPTSKRYVWAARRALVVWQHRSCAIRGKWANIKPRSRPPSQRSARVHGEGGRGAQSRAVVNHQAQVKTTSPDHAAQLPDAVVTVITFGACSPVPVGGGPGGAGDGPGTSLPPKTRPVAWRGWRRTSSDGTRIVQIGSARWSSSAGFGIIKNGENL